MNLNGYQREAQKTDRVPSRKNSEAGVDLFVPLLGLAGETGELLSEYKKHLRDGSAHLLFKDRVAEELGDLLWYVANVAANEANIAASMPPAIVSSKIYRCKDNSVAYIDWLAGDLTADIRSEQAGTPTRLTAAAAGGALKADGYSLIGLPTAKVVTLTRPGKGEQACKA